MKKITNFLLASISIMLMSNSGCNGFSDPTANDNSPYDCLTSNYSNNNQSYRGIIKTKITKLSEYNTAMATVQVGDKFWVVDNVYLSLPPNHILSNKVGHVITYTGGTTLFSVDQDVCCGFYSIP